MSVKVRGVGFSYPRGGRLLSEVSLDLRPGEVVCLLGANGSGKTTLLRCVAGLLPVREGSIEVAGNEISMLSRREMARRVGYLPQNVRGGGVSHRCLDVVLMGRAPYLSAFASPDKNQEAIAVRAMARVGASDLALRIFSHLSGGEQQLVVLARLLCQQTPVALLDEPAAHLDFRNQVLVHRLVRELADSGGLTVLMTSHSPEQVLEIADRVILLHGGRVIAQGRPEQVLGPENLSLTYATPVRVISAHDPETGLPLWVFRSALANPAGRGRTANRSAL